MNIHLNGEPRAVSDAMQLTDLLDQLGLAGKRIAVEINEELIPRSEHAAYVLQPGDRVEIVQAIGGG